MTYQTRSPSSSPNPDFQLFPRVAGEGNLAWGNRAVADMKTFGPKDWTYVVMLGGADTLSFRLCVAQSHLRSDMLPSFWSHALLVLLKDASISGAEASHVPLLQPDGIDYSPKHNGVVTQPLADFDDPVRYPNIAVVGLPVPQAKIEKRLAAFRSSRSVLDALEHALRWLAFAWGVARTGNPLHENYGLPSACMLETLCAAEGVDLTPGLESRASCPEAIWIAARHWHDYFEKINGNMPSGRFCVDHRFPIIEADDAPVASDGPGMQAKAKSASKGAKPAKAASKPKATRGAKGANKGAGR